jgi:hypothetical protein
MNLKWDEYIKNVDGNSGTLLLSSPTLCSHFKKKPLYFSHTQIHTFIVHRKQERKNEVFELPDFSGFEGFE